MSEASSAAESGSVTARLTPLLEVLSVELGFFAAFLDESIQLLSARGAQISDVWLDTGGVVFGVVVAYVIVLVVRRNQK